MMRSLAMSVARFGHGVRRGALACILTCAAVQAWADDVCGDMPVAADKVEWVGRDMAIDGTPTQAALITVNLSSNQVAATAVQFWRRRGIATHRMQNGPTLMVSALSAQCSYTLELPVNQAAPVRGLYSAMRLGQAKSLPRALRPANYPLPSGRIVLDMTSKDDGKIARTVQMLLPERSLEKASADYAAQLKRDGWHTIASGPSIGRPHSAPFGYALAMQKGGYRLDAAFAQARVSTSVVINVSDE